MRDFLEQQTLAGIVIRIGRQRVIRVFLRIRNVLGVAESVRPPRGAVFGDRTDKKIPSPASNYTVSKLDTKPIYRDFND